MLMATMMLPLAVSADTLSEKLEMADTTFTVNGKKIVVDDRQEQTIISVYSPDGEEMLKKKEVEFAGEQEIEKIYISSPFLPSTYNNVHKKQVHRFENHIPTIYYGASILPGAAGIYHRRGFTHRGASILQSGNGGADGGAAPGF